MKLNLLPAYGVFNAMFGGLVLFFIQSDNFTALLILLLVVSIINTGLQKAVVEQIKDSL